MGGRSRGPKWSTCAGRMVLTSVLIICTSSWSLLPGRLSPAGRWLFHPCSSQVVILSSMPSPVCWKDVHSSIQTTYILEGGPVIQTDTTYWKEVPSWTNSKSEWVSKWYWEVPSTPTPQVGVSKL